MARVLALISLLCVSAVAVLAVLYPNTFTVIVALGNVAYAAWVFGQINGRGERLTRL